MTAAAIRAARKLHCSTFHQFMKEYDRPGFLSIKFAPIDIAIIVLTLIVIAAS